MTAQKTGPARAEDLLTTIGQKLAWRDVAEIVIGSCALAFPVFLGKFFGVVLELLGEV